MISLAIITIIVALALPSIKKNLQPLLLIRISTLVFLFSALISFNIYYLNIINSGIGIYSGLFKVSTINQLFEIFLLIVASLILFAMHSDKNEEKSISEENLNGVKREEYKDLNYFSEYSLIVLFSTLGSSLLLSSYDLISLYLSIELQSFGVYILTTIHRNSEKSSNAGLKYFLLGGLSSCLILLGCGLIYSYTGLTNLEGIFSLLSVYDTTTQGSSLGLILIMLGLLFKISAAPLHNWAPDVYDATPTIVTIWITIMPKISILIFLLDLITQSSIGMGMAEIANINYNYTTYNDFINLKDSIKILLLLTSALSLIIGTVVGLSQRRIKRVLAYSTISHIGFILLALSINTEQSIEALNFYIIQYTISNLTIFLVIIGFGYVIRGVHPIISSNTSDFAPATAPIASEVKGAEQLGGNGSNENSLNLAKIAPSESSKSSNENIKDIELIYDIKGQFFSNPLLSLSLTICLFSMAGIPPLIGFFGKQFVLYSALQSGYYFISILAILVSVISAFYYLRIIRLLYSEESMSSQDVANVKRENNDVSGSAHTLSNLHSFLISTLTLTIMIFVLKPSILLNSTQLLSLSLFNY
jgi:NADH-ubiquinone oxidoreductase chain 2